MNKTYRLVWSACQDAFVAAAESTRSRGKRGAVLVGAAILSAPALAQLPTGGQIVAGSGSISQSGSTMTITQDTARMAADWQSFSIGAGHTVNFVQPSASAIALNRVLGSDVSVIQGALNANGQVFLINPNGVLFTTTAQVDVGGIVASTLNLSNADFMAGRYGFEGASSNAVINQGNVKVSHGGTAAFIAARIENTGRIEAPRGNVVMGAGGKVTLDMGGPVKIQVEQGAIDALIEQGGAIKADGGLVYLTARAADALTQSVINHSGLIEASSLTEQGGKVVLEGDRIQLANGSQINATGGAGGGEVLVGGGWQGTGGYYQATKVTMDSGASIDVSATKVGAGGTAVLWSDIHKADSQTRAYGTIWANGGAEGGDGGRIETSGHWLSITGSRGGAAATNGTAGLWLLDPYNVTITGANANGGFGSSGGTDTWTPNANNSTILNTDINSKLEGGTNVTITTTGAGSQIGDITVSSAITKGSGNTDVTLTLQAANSIVVDQAISNSGGTGKLHVVLDADNDNGTRNGGGIIILNNDITTNGGNLSFGTGATMSIGGVTTKVGGDVYVGGSSALSLTTAGGNVTVNGEMLIANTNGLSINTSNGSVSFGGLLNSANQYTFVDKTGDFGTGTWDQARTDAINSTGGGSAVGDSYLVNITSRLENAVAVRSTNYVGAWIGAYRPDQTSGAWKWADGPESGQTFFNQTTGGVGGGTTVSGYYANFDSLEPNGNFTAPPAVVETRGQVTGATGPWNDLNNTTTYSNTVSQYNVLGFIRETNLAASPLTVSAGSGNVTFSGAVGSSKALASLNVTTTGTIAINGGAVTTTGVQTYNGNVTLGSSSTTLTQTNANTDFTLQAGKSITNATSANASLLIKTTRDILIASASSISSSAGALSVTLNSDSDATDGGAIWLQTAGGTGDGATISSNGGNITLSGGTDVTTGYAQGRTTTIGNGITLDAATLNSAGGNILLRGKGTSGGAISIASKDSPTSQNTDGIRLHGSNTLNAGAGTISFYGEAQGTGASNGIELNQTGTTTIQSSNATANAILLDGRSSNAGASNGYGVYTWGASILATNGGGITLNGTGAKNAGVEVAINGSVLANSGKITLNGTGAGTGGNSDVVVAGTVGQKAATAITSSTSAIDVIADTISLSGTLQSSGALTFKPRSTGTTIGIAGGAGTLQLTAANFSTHIADGFSSITIGRNDGTGKITAGAFTANDNLTLLNTTGNIELTGALNAGTNTVTLNSTGTVTQSAAITAGSLALLGTGGSHTLTNTGNNVTTLAANTGSVSFYDSNGLTIGTVGATNGITATAGTVLVESGTGDIGISQNVSASSTGTSAIIINAGKTEAANTATGGNIVLSGTRTFTTGAGGRAILYSGDASASTGLSSLVTNAGGTLTYNADEATTPTPTGGVHAIYRGSEPPATTSTTTTSDVPKDTAVSSAQTAVTQPIITSSTTANVPSPGAQSAANLGGGLTFVEVSGPQGQGGGDTTNVQSMADLPPGSLGRDPLGFMRVFVVNGGVNLPAVALRAPGQGNRNDANQ